ncbi:hypothetical protein pEaSNUABM37_00035 [Erwinia phage pEa_SNUABM_37]|nr:hypothetical protein pEaSNUABM37_00035 [Erwinia phage pEa_SNUABM_37]QXO10505.1 hypothetical protein pEaSNUABM48_00035 [Erwinia phage pEa_SNUABM_48]
MREFYITRVGDSHTFNGDKVEGAIGITAKNMKGNEYTLRLLPGFDPYMSLLIVRNGLLGLYRFDRRMSAMSDRSEVEGIDHEAISTIARELGRNLLSEESGVIFLKQIVGQLMFPGTVVTVGSSPVYAGNQLVFTLTQQRFSLNYAVGLGKMPIMHLNELKKTITGIEPTFAKLFAKMVRKSYGRGVSVSFSNLIIKQ